MDFMFLEKIVHLPVLQGLIKIQKQCFVRIALVIARLVSNLLIIAQVARVSFIIIQRIIRVFRSVQVAILNRKEICALSVWMLLMIVSYVKMGMSVKNARIKLI